MATKKSSKGRKTAAKKATTAVAKAEPVSAEMSTILSMVAQDINNAEVGKFYALRAGVGLQMIKELSPHGEFVGTMTSAMPNRSPRTLRRYMVDAKKFLDEKALTASEVWQGLAEFDPAAMLAQGGGGSLLLCGGDGSEAEVPSAVSKIADYLNNKTAEKAADEAAEGDRKPRKLTKRERTQAAQALWGGLAAKAQTYVTSNEDWKLLNEEELDAVASAFTVVAASMKKELKTR